MTKQQAISQMILAKQAQGMTITKAIDEVLGKGTSQKVIDQLWEDLRNGKS